MLPLFLPKSKDNEPLGECWLRVADQRVVLEEGKVRECSVCTYVCTHAYDVYYTSNQVHMYMVMYVCVVYCV